MKVVLTGKRKGTSVTLCGVDFIDGVGVLNSGQIRAEVFPRMLQRYYAVEMFSREPEVSAKQAAIIEPESVVGLEPVKSSAKKKTAKKTTKKAK